MNIPWTQHLQALKETRVWCDAHLDPGKVERLRDAERAGLGTMDGLMEPLLRSEILKPAGFQETWWSCDLRADAIEEMVQKRRKMLPPILNGVASGRILCVAEGIDTSMGEGVPSSSGVMDRWYMPPWDTWFAYLSKGNWGILLAWIPKMLTAEVQNSMEVAASEPLRWLDEIPTTRGGHWTPDQEGLVCEAHRALVRAGQI